jgi:tetratricopeptide (TPR) repeat protein
LIRSRRWLPVLLWLAVATSAVGQNAAPAADARSSSWREIRTPDLTVVGNAQDGELKRALRELTGFRAALNKLLPGWNQTSPVPTFVVVLKDQDAFGRFQPRDSSGKRMGNVGGYFTRQPDANFIVFGSGGDENNYQTIFHEYTHYIVERNSTTSVPMWVNEGLADFFSTFRREFRGHSLVGALPNDRVRLLKSRTFVPLRDVVAPTNLEKTWRWPGQIGMLYAESWALVHYITVGRPSSVRAPLSTYVNVLAKTGSHDTAFKEAFGTDIEGMDKELREYVRRVTLSALLMDIDATADERVDSQPMRESDARTLQARLLLEMGSEDEAVQELDAALKRDPEHVPTRISLARVKLRQRHDDEAIAMLRQIVEAAPADAAAHYYLGTALEHSWQHEAAVAAFTRATELNRMNPYSWIQLTGSLRALNRDAQAAATLQRALTLENSPDFYWTQAIHAIRLGRNDIAASSLQSYLDRRAAGEGSSVYPLFVAAIANWRAGRQADADAALSAAEKFVTAGTWPATVQQYLQGHLNMEPFLAKARSQGETTEAHTYIGFKLDMLGRHEDALTHFRWVAEHGAKTYLEYQLTMNELDRLKHAENAPSK